MDSDEPPQPISSGYRLDLVVKFLVVHIKMPKLNVNMLALFFYLKILKKMSRKLYNNRDKKRRALLWQMEYISK